MVFLRMIFSIAAVCVLVQAGGCSDAEGDENSADEKSSDAVDGISPVNVNGVIVFSYTPDAAYDALLTGVAEIRKGCLVVDQAVVIWHSETMDDVRDLVARVRLGARPRVAVGGGGDSLEEGGSDFIVPSVVEEHCSDVTGVWYGSASPLTITSSQNLN